ncbi:putative phosphatidate cytidylyltransferase, partial [Plasmodium gaboni]
VPSDITLLEYKYSKNNKKKKINSLKKLFIYLSFFTFGNNCNKLNSQDVIHILSNVYSDNKISNDEKLNTLNILNILNTRQKDIDRQDPYYFQCFA